MEPNNPSYEQSKQVAEQSRESEWKLPSFGRQMYLGDFQLDLIHPQPKLGPEAIADGEDFLGRLRAFLAERVDPLQIEQDSKLGEDVIGGLKKLGALGMKIPKEYGGLGLTQLYYNRALAMAGTWSPAISTLLSAHQSIGLPEPLKHFGSEEQKREWLPKVAKDHISAFLLTEPDVGSDPARMSASAVPTEDGSGYIVNGTKLWATNGVIADVVVVMAVVPKSDDSEGGITAFICPMDSAGITVKHRNEFMGLRGIENSVTEFEDVFIPKENVIAGEGRGLRIALGTLNTGRLSLPAICAGISKYSLKIARQWAIERKQWGHELGRHDPVAQKLALIAGTAFGLEAMVDVTSRMADDKRRDFRIEAAIAKLYASERGWEAVDTMVQVRGGRGYETAASLAARGEKPVPAEQMLRDMRINRIFEGSTEIMHLMIAREAVDQHLQIAGDILLGDGDIATKAKLAVKAAGFYARWLPSLVVGEGQKPSAFAEFGALAPHLRYAERSSRRLARSTFYAMGRYQARLEQKGALLGRIVDIGSELFAIAAACTYASTLAEETPANSDSIYELADLFCQQSRRRAERLFTELWANDDDRQYRLAQSLLEGRYRFFEHDVLDPAGEGPMMPETTPEQAVEEVGRT
ncbi:MAG TPA: acyl-CoA dehydrogenase family protein [Solirubrobacteraceae bacterium]|nr:acyl-CoA dehydrogenase family protein [Solirubrobacteraceae bacterium]